MLSIDSPIPLPSSPSPTGQRPNGPSDPPDVPDEAANRPTQAVRARHAYPGSSSHTRRRRVRPTDLKIGALFHHVRDAVIVGNVDTGLIELWNRAAERLFGYTAQEAVGQPIDILMPPPVARIHREGLARYRRSGHGLLIDAAAPVELPAVTRLGDPLRVELSLSPIDAAPGEPRYVLAIVRDVTERRRAELTRLELTRAETAREQAESALRQRDEFLTVAAHELKTPLTGLKGYAQLLIRHLQRLDELDRDMLVRASRTLDMQTDKLSRLVGQLLDVTQLDAGRFGIHTEPTDLARLTAEVVELMRQHSSEHEIALTAPASLPAQLDPLRIERVLMALLDNALKYNPSGCRVEVILDEPAPGTARLVVRDYGAGVPPARRARLFERYFRAHDDTHASGMGLGLYLSRETIELHGGRMLAQFPPTGGTRIVITLPTHAAEV